MRVLAKRMRTLTTYATAALFLLLAGGNAAQAASPPITVQAAAANAAFLAYAPPPPGGARALCLVDTGVNATPDTAPGLVSATALDGGSGADVDPLWHGTIDAAIAGGAGHGVLGAWPQLKIVSVRGTDVPSPGQAPTYQFDDYINGINDCSRGSAAAEVAVIALPLSSTIAPTADQTVELMAAINGARAKGISILAAAGNAPGSIQFPASHFPRIKSLAAPIGRPRAVLSRSLAVLPSSGVLVFGPSSGVFPQEVVSQGSSRWAPAMRAMRSVRSVLRAA